MLRNLGLSTILFLASVPAAPAYEVEEIVDIVFSEIERQVIREYYSNHAAPGHSKSKGKHKSKGLPPGIAKNLERGKPLPPGIAKQTLPYNLTKQLPPPPKGYERIIVAGKIILIEVATQVIRDILTDVLFD